MDERTSRRSEHPYPRELRLATYDCDRHQRSGPNHWAGDLQQQSAVLLAYPDPRINQRSTGLGFRGVADVWRSTGERRTGDKASRRDSIRHASRGIDRKTMRRIRPPEEIVDRGVGAEPRSSER